jgi:hypothetical protein
MKRIQILEKQNKLFRMLIDGVECVLIKITLYVGNNLEPKPAVVKGSTLGWNFKHGFVSYNQLKKEILQWLQRNAPAKHR